MVIAKKIKCQKCGELYMQGDLLPDDLKFWCDSCRGISKPELSNEALLRRGIEEAKVIDEFDQQPFTPEELLNELDSYTVHDFWSSK